MASFQTTRLEPRFPWPTADSKPFFHGPDPCRGDVRWRRIARRDARPVLGRVVPLPSIPPGIRIAFGIPFVFRVVRRELGDIGRGWIIELSLDFVRLMVLAFERRESPSPRQNGSHQPC
ncbi:MAG: hypothetical protein R3B96_19205 [Pirellulaceae bacterium]